MKNKRILCAALLAAAASLTTGCQKEEVEPEVPATPAKGMPVYVETMTGDTKLRTQGLTVEWENGDQILIGPDNYSTWNAQKEVYDITVSGSNVSVDYTPDATAKVAFFPKNLVGYFGSVGVIGAVVPSEYTVRTSNILAGGTVYNRNHIDLPMFAQMPANPSSITFQHLTGCIYLYVKNPTSKELILDEVELSHSRRKLCGTVEFARMDQPNSGQPADRTVKVVYPDGLSIPAGGEVRNVQVPVLPIDGSNNGKLTLKIKCHTVTSDLYYAGKDVHVFEYTAPSPTVGRNQMINTKVNFDYENDPNNRITTTKGGFGLPEGLRVFIAATNLRWKATTSRDDAKFTFGNPADVWYSIGNTPANTTDEYSGSGVYTTDLFGYGTYGLYSYYGTTTVACTPDLKRTGPIYYPDRYFTREDYNWGLWTAYSTTSNSYSSTGWYTLTTDDWKYMLCDDNEYNDRRAWGKVNNHPGIILLPDNYVHPEGVPAIVPYEVTSRPTTGETMAEFSYTNGANEYTEVQFSLMRRAGAVFLGANTGWRDTGSDTPYKDPSYGCYWGSDKASIYFGAGVIGRKTGVSNRPKGYAVRLARDVE